MLELKLACFKLRCHPAATGTAERLLKSVVGTGMHERDDHQGWPLPHTGGGYWLREAPEFDWILFQSVRYTTCVLFKFMRWQKIPIKRNPPI